MDVELILQHYRGKALNWNDLSEYQRWALKFFRNEKFIADPYLDITLQLDITKAKQAYSERYAMTGGASFTAYLTWQLLATTSRHECFNYRLVDGKWYHFANLPLFFPVAVGGKQRFCEVFLEDVIALDWNEFCLKYRSEIDKVMQGKEHEAVANDLWELAIFVGNLPYLQFSSLKMHRGANSVGRPVFYFGKRYRSEGKDFAPLYIALDHGNTDPYVLNLFLNDYCRAIENN